jgi:P-type Cu2+ transporter
MSDGIVALNSTIELMKDLGRPRGDMWENDAPALAQAHVGIAISAGTNVAVAAADIVLVRNNPLDVTSILGLARATYRKMVQNLGWATGYYVIAIPVAAGVLYTYGIVLVPAVGVRRGGLMSVEYGDCGY